MTNTFWEAVKISLWDFRPHSVDVNELEADDDTPGAREKLDVLTERLRREAAAYRRDDRIDLRRDAERAFRRSRPR